MARNIPVVVYVLAGLAGIVGAYAGYAASFGYDLIYGPWFPQAGVNPDPAGWVGWWIGGGAMAGVVAGSIAGFAFFGLWRLIVRGSRA